MNSWYLQFVFAMVLVINGILCDSDQEMLHCEYRGNDDMLNFTVAAGADDEEVSLDVNANITCTSDATDKEFSFNIVCQDEWRILLRVPRVNGDIVVEAFDHDGEPSFPNENHPPNYPIFLLSQNNFWKISAGYPDNNTGNKRFMISAWTVKVIEQIDTDSSDSSCREVNTGSQGNGARTLECTTHSLYDDVLVSFRYKIRGPPRDRYLTFICSRLDGQSFSPSTDLEIACKRVSNTLSIMVTAPTPMITNTISDVLVETIVFDRDSSLGNETVNPMTTVTTTGQSQPTSANPMTTVTTSGSSQPNSGKRNTASIVVPTLVVLIAVLLLVALVATIWRKRRNKQASEGNGTIALNIRSTVNQNEKTVVYNEIGEQDYITLFGGNERDDYHEYNVPDLPQERTSVDRTTASGSGPYQELFQDETRAVAIVNRPSEVTGPRHGVADDRHAYQDLRQDKRSVSGVNQNGEMPNKLPSKDTPATENGYQALKTATPEYATLEPSPEYATLEQNDESMTATSDVSGPPADKQYDTLQRSLNTVGQPPSAGYGTLKPMNEADADYESPDGNSKTTSDVNDSTRPTEALPNNQPKTRHPGAYGDDDYQTPIEPAEDLTNAYQTLDNPGYQQEPDTQAEEYSHLQRSLGAKLQSHPSSNHDNSDSYGKLHLNGTP